MRQLMKQCGFVDSCEGRNSTQMLTSDTQTFECGGAQNVALLLLKDFNYAC